MDTKCRELLRTRSQAQDTRQVTNPLLDDREADALSGVLVNFFGRRNAGVENLADNFLLAAVLEGFDVVTPTLHQGFTDGFNVDALTVIAAFQYPFSGFVHAQANAQQAARRLAGGLSQGWRFNAVNNGIADALDDDVAEEAAMQFVTARECSKVGFEVYLLAVAFGDTLGQLRCLVDKGPGLGERGMTVCGKLGDFANFGNFGGNVEFAQAFNNVADLLHPGKAGFEVGDQCQQAFAVELVVLPQFTQRALEFLEDLDEHVQIECRGFALEGVNVTEDVVYQPTLIAFAQGLETLVDVVQ